MATTRPDAYTMVDFDGVYANTTASSANVLVTSGGVLQRATSSLKYKRDVEPIPPEKVDELIAVMADAAIWYRSRCAADNPTWGYYGLSAEALAGPAPQFVHFRPLPGGGLEPEGVMYERAVVPLLLKVRELEKRLAMVETGQAGAAPIIQRVDVPGPERIVEVEKPVEVIREVERIVEVEVIREVPGPERIVEVVREVMVPAPAPEPAPVGNTLPEASARLLPEWVRDEMGENESFAAVRPRILRDLNVAKAELRRQRDAGDDSVQGDLDEIERRLNELARLGEG